MYVDLKSFYVNSKSERTAVASALHQQLQYAKQTTNENARLSQVDGNETDDQLGIGESKKHEEYDRT